MRALASVVLLCLLSVAAFADDDEDPGAKLPSPYIAGSNGSFSRTIPIDAPTIFALGPHIQLAYDSLGSVRSLSRPGGELGVGWTLQGLSVIQRVSGTPAPTQGQNKLASGRGAPAYGAPGFPVDSFLLDGTELVPCAEVPDRTRTPSCVVETTGSSFTSRVETFLRIRRNSGNNSWEVTSRTGVKSVYSSLEGTSSDLTYRWHLDTVRDQHGNHVDYDWSCTSGHCIISAIRSYSRGATSPASEVIFYSEARPDRITYGDGRLVRAMTRRITAIDIRNAGRRQAAYRLTYEISRSTGLSRLVEVQKYGSDAVISNATVTGGSALPPYTMDYTDNGDADGDPVFEKQSNWSSPGFLFFFSGGPWISSREIVGDFNGDGWATDYYVPPGSARLDGTGKCYGSTPSVHYSNGRPALLPASRLRIDEVKCSEASTEFIYATGDVDGDMASDFFIGNYNAKKVVTQIYNQYIYVFGKISFVSAEARNLVRKFYELPDNGTLGFGLGSAGDFNGDGFDDYLDGTGWVVLSTPGNPGHPAVMGWGLDVSEKFWKSLIGVGDFNGDGRTDVIVQTDDDDYYRVYLSTGRRFIAQPVFYGGSRKPVIADVNGDGLSDLVFIGKKNDSDWRPVVTRLSNGVNFMPVAGNSIAVSSLVVSGSDSLGKSKVYRVGDFNGDGRSDLVIGRDTIRALGDSFERSATPLGGDEGVSVVADFDGDGADDIGRWSFVWLSRDGQPDLMTSFREPLGGRTTVAYTHSAGTPDYGMPFNMQVVSALALDDGRGTPTSKSVIRFDYEGGLWSGTERQFLGFRKVTATLPCIAGESTCPKQVLTYDQRPACVGQVALEQRYDGAGGLLSQTATSFAADTQMPFTCLTASVESRIYSGSYSKAVRQDFSHDLYGNTTQVIDNGVVGATGGETVTTTSFQPNTADYVVSCPVQTLVSQSATPGGAVLSATRLSYDGGGPARAPVNCDKTQQDDWTADSDWTTSHRWTYDARGNRVTETDGAGNTTTTVYDASYGLYPVETRLPNYGADQRFRVQTSWNLTCGQPATVTDVNGLVTTYSRDVHCRESYRKLPSGLEEWRSYRNFGNPSQQNVYRLSTPPGGLSTQRWTADYLDGFGRSWYTATRSPGDVPIVVLNSFDQRWNLAASTAPFYYDDDPYWTRFAYDKLDRPVRTTNPDGSFRSIAYGLVAGASLIATTTTDETGHKLVEATDHRGQRISRTRMNGDDALATQYIRDGLGRITRVIDPGGNIWRYSYDGMGRRVSVSDPDLGSWSYAYDDASRLVLQKDARGQRTELAYDSLSRLTQKTVTTASGKETTSNVYDEPRTGSYNRGQLTSATRSAGGRVFAQRYDYDAGGRLRQRTDLDVNGEDYTQAFEYWPDGTLRRKRLADGSWTGTYSYDLAGRLFSIGNANPV